MKAFAINCTLKPSPAQSNTDSLLEIVLGGLQKQGVEVGAVRAVDHDIKPGVESDMGSGDAWPAIREKIVAAEILVIATPTWLGKPSSVCQRVMERMDAMLSETDDEGRPIADRHRLHGARAGLDLLEPGPRPRPFIPGDGRRPRLVALHRRGGGAEPLRGGERAEREADAGAAEL